MDIRWLSLCGEPARPELVDLLKTHAALAKALSDWATQCPESKVAGQLPRVVVQDEYCHDVVVRWGERQYVVYATT